MKQLAIVIPYYKIDYFEATIQSLVNQTNKMFHVYIGDDASNHPPSTLLEKYQDQFTFTYSRFNDNLGSISLVKQWERCLKLVENQPWVMIVGDDDTLQPNVVASFYENLAEIENNNTSVIRFATQIINEHGDLISGVFRHPQLELAVDFLLRKFKGGTRSSLSEYIFKKEMIHKIHFKDFPLAWTSDTLAVIEFSCNQNIYTINEAIVNFRLSGKNITSQSDSKEKNYAWFQFYYYLLTKYGKQYPEHLVELIFDKIEKAQLNNKKTFFRWIKLFNLYISFSQYSRFFLLPGKIRRSIK